MSITPSSLSPTASQWVDYYFGNRNGILQKWEKDRFILIASTQERGAEIFARSSSWQGSTEAKKRFESLLQGKSEEEYAQSLIQNNLGDLIVEEKDFQSALVIGLSDSADFRSGTVYPYQDLGYDLGYDDLHTGMVLRSIMEASGARDSDYEFVSFEKPYPIRLDRDSKLGILWGVTHLDIKVKEKIDPQNPFILLSLLAGGPRDLFAFSGSQVLPYEEDFNQKRCYPQGSDKCATSTMTQDVFDSSLDNGLGVLNLARDKEIIYFPFPIGNVMKEALFLPNHEVNIEESLTLLERFLQEVEKWETPPVFVTQTMGSSFPFTAEDKMGNQLKGATDCRTYKMRAYIQENFPEWAEKKLSDSVCPLQDKDLEKIDQDMDEKYSSKLVELQLKYPNLVVIDSRPMFSGLVQYGTYTNPITGTSIDFPIEKGIDQDGIHFSPDFQPHLAGYALASLNQILGTHFELPSLNLNSMPSWLGDNLSEAQLFYLCIAETARWQGYNPESLSHGILYYCNPH